VNATLPDFLAAAHSSTVTDAVTATPNVP